jgi:hypothetical protein
VTTQINLFNQGAQVALVNGLIGETEALLKGVLMTLSNNFESNIDFLKSATSIILNMLGFLVVVPSNPEGNFF